LIVKCKSGVNNIVNINYFLESNRAIGHQQFWEKRYIEHSYRHKLFAFFEETLLNINNNIVDGRIEEKLNY